MHDFTRALSAELLKARRTAALWVAILAPLLVVGIQTIVMSQIDQPTWGADNAWVWLQRSTGAMWALFVFPMLIALITTLTNAHEHNSRGWKQLFALPVNRQAVYLAKLALSCGLLLIATMVLWGSYLTAGWVMSVIKPDFGLGAPAPMAQTLLTFVQIFSAAGLLISLHHWISARYASFAIAIGVGVAGTFIGMVQAKGLFQKLFPWKLPMNIQSNDPDMIPIALLVGILGGLALAVIGSISYCRRDVV
ncbi:MAG: ABC transporter permease [candidate division Zixibacteria bacterium]|nr:ABC transporter permease [candidate division Zixibacteria bacterium]MDH3938621.1 ABC transporter permease [candidate division Zixibacteria bacterium]MDH4032815.1 ABC transporter permease [candidate division Zixibacteria bacterium]